MDRDGVAEALRPKPPSPVIPELARAVRFALAEVLKEVRAPAAAIG